MPVFIAGGKVDINVPSQNSAIYMGQSVLNGWDANMKLNIAEGGAFGVVNIQVGSKNVDFDGSECLDGIMNDTDIKVDPTIQI